jgi:uncharacterized protein (TIGR03435 family)
MACSSSRVERKLPRRICLSVMAANQRSTRFSQLALQEQLVLKLESTKGPVAVIVIDSVGKPGDN